jgi:dTMP kinase
MNREGLFITFEGTEGAGKSTQIKILADRLASLGREILLLREPGGTPLGEQIRHLLKHHPDSGLMFPETELLLMNASRAQLVREVIQPALARGAVVLCDRFYDSTIAYQGFGRELDLAQIERVIQLATCGLSPNLTLLLRIPLETSESRRTSRGATPLPDRFEADDRSFFARVEKGYDSIAATCGDRVRPVDASQSIEKVAAEIWKWVQPLVLESNVEGERAFKTIGEYRPDKD